MNQVQTVILPNMHCKNTLKKKVNSGQWIICKREMDLPPEKRAHVCLACKSENGRSNVF